MLVSDFEIIIMKPFPAALMLSLFGFYGDILELVYTRAGTNTPSNEYDSYREYRVANTNMYSRIQ